MTIAILKSAGCRVFGVDLDPSKCELAKKMGADDASPAITAASVIRRTTGIGADAVIITASTESNKPIESAAAAVRQKGRIVLVGVVGLNIDRRPFYFKEIEFVVSCSYGPGRYDFDYEEKGNDYPFAYVRWTEQRNIAAVLEMMARGTLDVSPLISHRFSIDDATKAYAMIESGSEPYVGIVLNYPTTDNDAVKKDRAVIRQTAKPADSIGYMCVGAGNFARMVLLPELEKIPQFHPVSLVSSGGVSADHYGRKFQFNRSESDYTAALEAKDVQAAFLLTRHNQHAEQVIAALKSGKHCFVEKPLATTVEQLEMIRTTLETMKEGSPLLMVGFNRRFSPAAQKLKAFFADRTAPLTIQFRFNGGEIPADTWIQDDEIGGGRIIGEACHAIDTAVYLCGSPVVRVYDGSIGGPNAP